MRVWDELLFARRESHPISTVRHTETYTKKGEYHGAGELIRNSRCVLWTR
jgi:hypothetical protein